MNNQTRFFLIAICMVPVFSAGAATPEPAGRVQFAAGPVEIIGADNISRAAVKGGVINERETIVTGANGSAHLRMADDGVIAMRPDSRISIEQFRWQGKADGTERSVLGLLKGGFRTITGVIGRTEKSNYLVNTPTATIGIRGTDHEPFYIAAPEPGEVAAGEPGTYNKVNVGETFIRTGAGVIQLDANEIGFASLQPNIAPVKLDRIPNFMRRAPAPVGKPNLRNLRELAGFDSRQDRLAALRSAREERREALPLRFTAIRRETAQAGFELNVQRGGLELAPDGAAVVVGLTFDAGNRVAGDIGALVVSRSEGNVLVLDRSNNPFIVSNDTGFRYARQTAPLVDVGTATIDSTPVRWGVYGGGVFFTQQRSDIPANNMHFMEVPSLTPVSVLTGGGGRTYGMVAGAFTRPIDEANRVGGAVTAFNATVSFTANPRLDTWSIGLTDAGGRTWTGNLTGPITLRNFARSGGGANLTSTCGGCPAGAGGGETSGFVFGPNGNGIISSYRLQTGGGASLVTGSVAGRAP